MNITIYTPNLRNAFEEMLVTYFVCDLKTDIPEDIIRGKLSDLITDQLQKGTCSLAIGLKDRKPIGFSL